MADNCAPSWLTELNDLLANHSLLDEGRRERIHTGATQAERLSHQRYHELNSALTHVERLQDQIATLRALVADAAGALERVRAILAPVLEFEAKATPGPWIGDSSDAKWDTPKLCGYDSREHHRGPPYYCTGPRTETAEQASADADLIAAARNALPELRVALAARDCSECGCPGFDYEVGDHPGVCSCSHLDSSHRSQRPKHPTPSEAVAGQSNEVEDQ